MGAQAAVPRGEARVSPLELFFDLVFVFAITQVTELMSEHPTWTGLVEGMLALGALWWAWVAYAWLTNTLDVELVSIRLALLAGMAAMLVVSLATPGAFEESALAFGLAYYAVRLLHIVLYAAGSHDVDIRGATRRLAPTVVAGSTLILAAAAFDGWAQLGLWAVALAIDFLGPLRGGGRGWRVSPGHFAERHGLIVIIALGESIVALGVGAAGLPVDWELVVAALLGVVLAAGLWWAYFDFAAAAAERRLRHAEGLEQIRLARDSYSYLHFPLVAGIILTALGIKKTIGHLDEELDAAPAFALTAGVALYLLGHVAFRLRDTGTLNGARLLVGLTCLALFAVATSVPAVAVLAALAALTTALIAYETLTRSLRRARAAGASPGPR